MRVLLAIAVFAFSGLQAKVNFIHKNDPFATHQPVLYELALKTEGPIIEFGCGNSSTDMLHEICKKNNRLLISIDDNEAWLNKFRKKYRKDSSWHKFFHVSGRVGQENADHWVRFLENNNLIKNTDFAICFVDQSPWAGRVETIKRLKSHAKYIVLHDCDYFARGECLLGTTIKALDAGRHIPGEYDFSKSFRHFKVYFPLAPWAGHTGPPTLVASDYTDDFPETDYKNYQ